MKMAEVFSIYLIQPEYLGLKYGTYIRGFFDGDGCFTAKWTYAPQLTFYSTYNFVTSLNEYFQTQLDETSHVRPSYENIDADKSKCWIATKGGPLKIEKIMKWIYSTPALDLIGSIGIILIGYVKERTND